MRAILPSGSAGKFLKKIWNLEKLGGEEAIFASVLRPPQWVHCAIFLFLFLFIIIYKYVILILYFRKDVFLLAREKSTVEYQNVTVRIPKELYASYKKVLISQGKIPTYDIRNHMFEVVKDDLENTKGEE